MNKPFSHYQVAKKMAQSYTLEELQKYQTDVQVLPGNSVVDEQFTSWVEDAIIMKMIELNR